MNETAISVIQAVVRDELRGFRTAELAVVSAVYPHAAETDDNNYECDVRLRDSGLELKRVPLCVQRIGAAAIPNVDDMVLVQFLHGEVDAAVIVGRLYNDAVRAPLAKEKEFVYISPDDEQPGVRRLYIELPAGQKLTVDDAKIVLESGKTTLTINHDGDVELDSNAKLVIRAKGDAEISTQGNLALKAKGDVAVQGANVSLTGSMSATVDGGASTTVKAGSIKLAGKTDFSVA